MISVVNGLVPTIVKNVVWLEGWPSQVTLRHQMGRIFLIKMLNILVLFAKVHSTSGETRADEPCHATVAGKTFMQLIVSDFFVATFSASVPKLILWKWKIWPHRQIPWLFGTKQPFDLPKEVIDLVYRQALMWTGAIYAPMICWFGLLSSALMYFIKYFCLRLLHKPPRRPFSAASIQTFFLQLLLASLFFPIVCFCVFVNATASQQCGPMRDPQCVLPAGLVAPWWPYNETCDSTCLTTADAAACCTYNTTCDDARSNFKEFNDYFLPSSLDAVDVTSVGLGALSSGAAVTESVTSDGIESFGSLGDAASGEAGSLSQVIECNHRCWIKTVITSLVSVPMLLLVTAILAVALRFSRAQAARLAKEVKAAHRQLQEEHHDKIKLMRVAGITLD